MAYAKTRPTTAPVNKHLASLMPPEGRAACESISRIFAKATHRLRSGDGFAERLAAITPRKLEGGCASLALNAVSPAYRPTPINRRAVRCARMPQIGSRTTRSGNVPSRVAKHKMVG